MQHSARQSILGIQRCATLLVAGANRAAHCPLTLCRSWQLGMRAALAQGPPLPAGAPSPSLTPLSYTSLHHAKYTPKMTGASFVFQKMAKAEHAESFRSILCLIRRCPATWPASSRLCCLAGWAVLLPVRHLAAAAAGGGGGAEGQLRISMAFICE